MPIVSLPDGTAVAFARTSDPTHMGYGVWLAQPDHEFYHQNGKLYIKNLNRLYRKPIPETEDFTLGEHEKAVEAAWEMFEADPWFDGELLEGPYVHILRSDELPLFKLLVLSKLAESGGKAQQLIKQGAVRLDDAQTKDPMCRLGPGRHTLSVSKARFHIDLLARE